MDIGRLNLFGAVISIIILVCCIAIFIFRLSHMKTLEYWIGIAFILTAIPLTYLLLNAAKYNRPTIYYIQLGIMITSIIIELLLDYILKVDFRNTHWLVIIYVMFFFAGTGGMIGIASQAGKVYSMITVSLFLIMAFLAFYQRIKTGM
jgi:hypothetical protein